MEAARLAYCQVPTKRAKWLARTFHACSAALDGKEQETVTTLAEIRAKLKDRNNQQPQRELTQEEQIRADKLQGMIERLERGEHIQNRMLKTWLTGEEYAELREGWTEQLDVREELRDKPEEVKRYEELIRAADFEYHKRNYYKADAKYERALEYLQEIVAADRLLMLWFDRDTKWTADGDLSLEPTGVPRCKTSRSANVMTGRFVTPVKLSKRQVKIDVLERILRELTTQ